jgi:hypothetical protein
VLTHLQAVQRGIVDRPPLLQGAAPAAAVVIAFFEFTFYWALCVAIAALLYAGWHRAARRPRRG